MNPYETLGVGHDATLEEIQRAYRRAASAAHPDRAGGSEERMQELNAAFDLLRDPTKRKAWDEKPSEVEEFVMTLFEQALTSNPPNTLNFLFAILEEEGRAIQLRREKLQSQLARLEAVTTRVVHKTMGRNLHTLVVNRQVARTKGALVGLDQAEQLRRDALALLRDYTETPSEAGPFLQTFSCQSAPFWRRKGD